MERTPLLRKPYANVASIQDRKSLGGEVMFADPMRIFPGQATVYNPSILVSRHSMRVFEKMRRDDQIKAALNFKKQAIVASGWEIVSPKDQPDEWEVTETIRENMAEITTDERTLDDLLTEILSALDFGFSISEKIYDQSEGQIWLEDIRTVSPHEIEFEQAPTGTLERIIQSQTGAQARQEVPREKVVLFTHQREFANLYGTSDLEAAYRAWVVKDNSYKWLAMYLERLGIPPIFALYNPRVYNGQPLNDLKTVIDRMQAATFGALPRANKDDLDFWAPQLANQAQSVFIPAIEMFNKDMARALLMPSLLGFTSDGAVGSQARAQTHFDVFLLAIERLRKQLSATIQAQVIRPLVKLNYGEQEAYPDFRFLALDEDAKVGLLEQWTSMINARVVTPQQSDEGHIRSLLKMPERQEGDEMVIPEIEREIETELKTNHRKYQVALSVDYAAIDKRLLGIEKQVREDLKSALIDVKEALLKRAEMKKEPVKILKDIKLRKFNIVRQGIRGFLRDVFETGRQDLRSELVKIHTQKYASPIYTPTAALKWLEQKAFWITGILEDRILKEAQAILMNAVKTGEAGRETKQKLATLFDPYIGDPDILRAGEALEPRHLDTIVRTNLTDAYNVGRLTEARNPELSESIRGMMYSAVLDNRTTEQCSLLNGKIIKIDDANADKLTPPLHYNCRSILVAVPYGVPIDDYEMIDQSTAGKALDLTETGFGGTRQR